MLISWLATAFGSVLKFVVLSIEDSSIQQSTNTPETLDDRRPAMNEYEATVNHEYGSIYYPDDD